MDTKLSRAREIARELQSEFVILDNQLTDEIAGILDLMAECIETQTAKIAAAEFALNYYREPGLYLTSEQQASPTILDGGLRARTALTELQRPVRCPLPRRVPLPDID